MDYYPTKFSFILAIFLCACDKAPLPTEPPLPSATAKPSIDASVIKNSNPISFEGFGPAKFGSSEEAVRMSWGRPLVASKPADGSSCYYLHSDLASNKQHGISFMLEDGAFVRYDIDDKTQVAPGNIKVGDTSASVMQAHVGHFQSQPHKYIKDAYTLVVTPVSPSNARLIFETDVNGIVTNWRIGVTPQVYYVEGCG